MGCGISGHLHDSAPQTQEDATLGAPNETPVAEGAAASAGVTATNPCSAYVVPWSIPDGAESDTHPLAESGFGNHADDAVASPVTRSPQMSPRTRPLVTFVGMPLQPLHPTRSMHSRSQVTRASESVRSQEGNSRSHNSSGGGGEERAQPDCLGDVVSVTNIGTRGTAVMPPSNIVAAEPESPQRSRGRLNQSPPEGGSPTLSQKAIAPSFKSKDNDNSQRNVLNANALMRLQRMLEGNKEVVW